MAMDFEPSNLVFKGATDFGSFHDVVTTPIYSQQAYFGTAFDDDD